MRFYGYRFVKRRAILTYVLRGGRGSGATGAAATPLLFFANPQF